MANTVRLRVGEDISIPLKLQAVPVICKPLGIYGPTTSPVDFEPSGLRVRMLAKRL